MNQSNDVTNQVQAALETAGLDSRGQHFVVMMLGITLGTAAVGTALLMLANWRSRKRIAVLQSDSAAPQAGQEAAEVIGSAIAAKSTNDVNVSLNCESHRLTEPKQEKQGVSHTRRACQVFVAFSVTFGLCTGVTIAGLKDGSLTKERGLAWESYVLLLSSACSWLVAQALIIVLTLEPGRAYVSTAFGEAMLGGMFPFVADSFDTLKDVLFGGLCFQSSKTGLHVLGVFSWAYLYVFHVCLLRSSRVLLNLSASHLSVFALSTTDLNNALSSGLSRAEKVMALLAKQLSPTKRLLLLIENIPQAGMAIIYLAVEGGSLLVALLNLAIPAAQVLASIFLHSPLQKRLARWYAQRLDASIEDADAVLGRRICSEISKGFLPHVAKHSRSLGAILDARARALSDLGHVVVADDKDELGNDLCWACVASGWRPDGAINMQLNDDLGGQADVLSALVDFAFKTAWVQEVHLRWAGLTAEDVATLTAAMTESPHRRRLRSLQMECNSFGDEGAKIIAGALTRLVVEELFLGRNDISDIGALAIAEALPQCAGLRHLGMCERIGEEAKRALREACAKKDPNITLDLRWGRRNS